MDGTKFRVSACALSLLAATGCQYRTVSVSYSLPMTAQVSHQSSSPTDDCAASGPCSHYAGTAWEDYGARPAPGTVNHHETTAQLTVWPLHRVRFGHPCDRDGTIVRLPPAPTILVAECASDGYGTGAHCPSCIAAAEEASDPSADPSDHSSAEASADAGWAQPGASQVQSAQQPAIPQPEVDSEVPGELAQEMNHADISADDEASVGTDVAPPKNSIPASAASAVEPNSTAAPPAPLPTLDLKPRRSVKPSSRATVPVQAPQSTSELEERTAEPVTGAAPEAASPAVEGGQPTGESSDTAEPPRNVLPPHLQGD